MKRLRHPIFSLCLVSCFLFVGAVLTSLGAAHTLHHADHKAPTHASVVCSWMCAAGQASETIRPILQTPTLEIGAIDSTFVTPFLKASVPPFFSRGPPVL